MPRSLPVVAAVLTALVLTGCAQAQDTLNKAVSAAPNAAAAACASSTAAAVQVATTALPAGQSDVAIPAIKAAISTARSTAAQIHASDAEWAQRLTAAADQVEQSLPDLEAAGASATESTLQALQALASACPAT